MTPQKICDAPWRPKANSIESAVIARAKSGAQRNILPLQSSYLRTEEGIRDDWWATTRRTALGGIVAFPDASRRRGSAPLPEFAYQDFTLRVLQADGTPVAGAAVYGFCPETNLLWPRRSDVEVARNSRVWEDAFLEKTGADGSVKVTVPPGKWGFFASADKEHIVAWTDFRERHPDDTIELKPATTRRWTLACSRIESLNPTRIFRQAGFVSSVDFPATRRSRPECGSPDERGNFWLVGEWRRHCRRTRLCAGLRDVEQQDRRRPNQR